MVRVFWVLDLISDMGEGIFTTNTKQYSGYQLEILKFNSIFIVNLEIVSDSIGKGLSSIELPSTSDNYSKFIDNFM